MTNSQNDSCACEMLAKDNAAMRSAGCELVSAAMYVIGNYDGLHRLALAAAKFITVVANEGKRDER